MMASKSIDLYGTLRGGIVGPGAETTGYVIEMPEMDVDLSGVRGDLPKNGTECTIAGDIVERNYPVRRRVRTLHAREIVVTPAQLSRNGARGPVILQGTLRTGIIRPGGEGPSASLVGAAPGADLSHVQPGNFLNKQVRATGSFVARHYTLLGLRYVFAVTALQAGTDQEDPVDPAPTGDPSAPPSGKVSATGYSDAFSFEEAVRDAIAQLPKAQLPADYLLNVTVDSIGAQIGGFAGLSRLKVTVSTTYPAR
jgi:hypothetical protein